MSNSARWPAFWTLAALSAVSLLVQSVAAALVLLFGWLIFAPVLFGWQLSWSSIPAERRAPRRASAPRAPPV